MSAPAIPFRKEFAFTYDVAERLTPLVRRMVANNPTPFTQNGTNTFIVGNGTVAVIDPGPALPEHVAALARALADETVSHIIVTHTHMDHSPAAAMLKAAVGGEVVGAHPRAVPEGAAPAESIQYDFAPDRVIADGDVVSGPGWTLQAVYTPGHISNHHCFALAEEETLFSGDHVMGWNTTIVSPPDGNMREYLASLNKCLARDDRLYRPAHGPEIDKPQQYVRALLGHRRARETEIAACLGRGIATVPEMVAEMYRHIPAAMHGAAGRSVLAHLEHMVETGRVATDGPVTAASRFRLP